MTTQAVKTKENDISEGLFFISKQRRIIHKYLTIVNSFEKNIIPEPNSGCWLWAGFSNSCGYGCFSFKNKICLSHRLSYRLTKGIISKNLVVRHTCNTPACVNPNHLVLGTQSENILDSVRAGRWQRHGKYSNRSRVTPEQVRFIRSSKLRQVDLAKLFHVTKTCIHLIKNLKRQSWVAEVSK